MEHLQCECEYYSELQWGRLGDALTQPLNNRAADWVPRVELGQTNIIYNIPYPSILLRIPDKAPHNTLLLIIEEIEEIQGISSTDG
jgi:hypothetical protein